MPNQRRNISLASLTVLSIGMTAPRTSWGFAEDVCWRQDGSGVVACTPLPAACQPVGTTSAACRSAALAVAGQVGQLYPLRRSSIHVDATYVLAQAVGFDADDAYWIAAYDEATDLGWYEAIDPTGAPVGGGGLRTATLDGLVRTNLASGGVYFHFVAPRDQPGVPLGVGVDGLHPDLGDPTEEGFLVHLRAWALAGTGASRPLCADGLSTATAAGDLALGAACFARPGGLPASIAGALAAIAQAAVSFTVPTGRQIIVAGSGSTRPTTSDHFDEVIDDTAAHTADARLGIYLHAVADRISHHVCTDTAELVGPTGAARSFDVAMTSADCTQGLHALRHMWEAGVEQDLLASQDRTLAAALTIVADELAAFADARGVLDTATWTPAARDALVAELVTAIESSDGGARLEAVRQVGCARGQEAFPGLAACAAP